MAVTRAMRQLARKQIDARLAAFHSIPLASRLAPRVGWIRMIREALGMSRGILGSRMGLSEKRIAQLELGEARGKLNVEWLKQAAEALDCDLVIALVPRRSLEQVVESRRAQLASSWIQRHVIHTMFLEGKEMSLEDLPSEAIRDVERMFPDESLWDER